MSSAENPAKIAPDLHTPKTFGILNVIFALGLLVCGVCQNFYAMVPAIMSYAGEAQAQQDARNAELRKAEIEKIRKEEATAADEQEKEILKGRRELLEATPEHPADRPVLLSDKRFRDPRYFAHCLFDLSTGLLLNVMMLIAGAGLIFLKGWARALAVIVAWAKILRLLFLAISMTVVVAPFISRTVAALEAEAIAKGAQGGANPASLQMGASIGLALTGFCWAVFLLGSIYPAVTIWLLRRPSVRAACRRPEYRDPELTW